MGCIGVPLTFLVSPISNSLLPEIARLRSLLRLPEALRLIDRTLALAGLAAVAARALGGAGRGPLVAPPFERGTFPGESPPPGPPRFPAFSPRPIVRVR